jgi:hypothetical protein
VVLVVRMASVLECITEEQHSVVRFFLWAKEIHKEMFRVYGGKCLSHNSSSQLGRVIATSVLKVSLMMMRLKRRCKSG